ncbi:hypothetical protein APHMUC_1198 [Anaplasma phagocytophilum str. ApMUC09]|uniref:Uncharacterized protein n=1 Tax=Anaplasma phagocytophilum str. ApMUC09 TaxID=1359152 RepID=A0A0F3ND76_ANAPH|nr:hypothetical protein APHMUC_1198 [Anaplasma phagocytophilum str. ApMUC09]
MYIVYALMLLHEDMIALMPLFSVYMYYAIWLLRLTMQNGHLTIFYTY